MDKGTVLNIINDFKKALSEKGIKIDQIVLFGSYADITNREGSDIDLVVISDSFKDMDYWQRIDVLTDAICDVFQPIEAVGMTSEEWENKAFFVAEYARKGEFV